MAIVTPITQEQANQLQQLIDTGQYPAAYDFLQEIVNADPNGDPKRN